MKPYPTITRPSLDEVLRAFDEPFNASCCRFAMRRAIAYLTDGTEQGRADALAILQETLQSVEARP